jgi:hypothetical protein
MKPAHAGFVLFAAKLLQSVRRATLRCGMPEQTRLDFNARPLLSKKTESSQAEMLAFSLCVISGID